MLVAPHTEGTAMKVINSKKLGGERCLALLRTLLLTAVAPFFLVEAAGPGPQTVPQDTATFVTYCADHLEDCRLAVLEVDNFSKNCEGRKSRARLRAAVVGVSSVRRTTESCHPSGDRHNFGLAQEP